MKSLRFCLALVTLWVGTACSPQTQTNECPAKPQGTLDISNVESIPLNTKGIKQSGIVNANKSVGYTFEVKSDQKLNYKTNDEICIWVYTPDNQILTNKELPQTGKYTMQISALQGTTTFEIEMSLETPQTIASSSPKPTTTTSSSSSKSNNSIKKTPGASVSSQKIYRPSPEKAVEDYYSAINNRKYQTAWDKLPSGIRNNQELHPNGYRSYTDWWETVDLVDISNTLLVEQNNESAVVDIQFKYIMKSGGESPQSLRFLFKWEPKNNRWSIEKIKLIS